MIMRRFCFFAFALLASVSCKHYTPEYVTFPDDEKSPFYVLKTSVTDVMDESPWEKVDFGLSVDEEETKATSASLNDIFRGVVSSFMSTRVCEVVGTYESTDIQGNPITVSGKVIYPADGNIKNMMIVSHYTIGANFECPSETFSFEGIYAAKGYMVVISDYIGFGVTKNKIHPYLQAETTARNVIDMALAVREWAKKRNIKIDSDEVVLLGYSQGGATTLHVQRLLETFPEYMGEFKIKINYAGAGPYDVARTYDYSVKVDVTGIPCAVPMIIQGMSIGMAKPLDMSYFFRDPLKSHYDEWLNSKKYTVPQMSALIGADKLSMILTPEGTDRSKPETARFYLELMENSIPRDYVPQAPLFMFHSEDDGTVPFINSQLMQRQFRYMADNIEYDFGHYGNHQKGALKFILKVLMIID